LAVPACLLVKQGIAFTQWAEVEFSPPKVPASAPAPCYFSTANRRDDVDVPGALALLEAAIQCAPPEECDDAAGKVVLSHNKLLPRRDYPCWYQSAPWPSLTIRRYGNRNILVAASQGASGLGLEAKREGVTRFLNGGDWSIVAEYTEVESGRKSDRPELEQALAAARLHRAPPVVAKLDRLTRSVAFLSRLLEAGVDVRFCDLPQIEGSQGRPPFFVDLTCIFFQWRNVNVKGVSAPYRTGVRALVSTHMGGIR